MDTAPAANPDPAREITATLPIDNFLRQTLLVAAVTVSAGDLESPEELAPMREVYVFGSPADFSTSVVGAER